MKAIFVDESKAKDFILCSVEVEVSEIPQLRRALYKLTLPGQSRIHIVSESPRRRRLLVTSYREMSLKISILRVRGSTSVQSRNRALEALISRLDLNSTYQLWIERDENHVNSDQASLTQALRRLGLENNVSFFHADPKSQPLLWLPDAFAWLANRGGDWAKELKKFDASVIYLN